MLKKTDATGQFTAPQNRHTSPTAAAKPGSSPSSPPKTQPNVAPIKNVGTISPPLKPALIVTAVKIIFSKNANGAASPFMAFSMMFIPAPL